MFYTFCYFPETSLLTSPLVNFSILFVCGGVGSWVCVWGGLCVWVGACVFPETSLLTSPLVNFSILFVCGGVGSWVCVWGELCVWVGACVLPIFPRTFTWQVDNTPTHRGLYTFRGPICVLTKYWLKMLKTSCFTILGGGGQHSEDFNGLHILLYIYEDTQVLGSISFSWGGVCVEGCGHGVCFKLKPIEIMWSYQNNTFENSFYKKWSLW